MFDENQARIETQKEVDKYKKLASLKNNEEVQELFNYQLSVAAHKMIYCFTGNNIANWDEFCKVRGEVIARLEPIQSVFTAEAAADQLVQQLKDMFAPEQ